MKKNKLVFSIAVGVILLLLMSFAGEKKEKVNLNYLTELINDKKAYTIDNVSYVESDEETNLIKIEIENKGIIIAELYPSVAPITVTNFKKLVSEKFYDNLIFHRVIKDFMIQTGDPTGTGTGGSDETIKGEFSINGIENELSHTRGVLSMARRGSDPETEETLNSASSQFFIVHEDSTYLDGKYAAFGKVLHGLDIVDYIANVSVNENNKPNKNVTITSIRFVTIVEEGE